MCQSKPASPDSPLGSEWDHIRDPGMDPSVKSEVEPRGMDGRDAMLEMRMRRKSSCWYAILEKCPEMTDNSVAEEVKFDTNLTPTTPRKVATNKQQTLFSQPMELTGPKTERISPSAPGPTPQAGLELRSELREPALGLSAPRVVCLLVMGILCSHGLSVLAAGIVDAETGKGHLFILLAEGEGQLRALCQMAKVRGGEQPHWLRVEDLLGAVLLAEENGGIIKVRQNGSRKGTFESGVEAAVELLHSTPKYRVLVNIDVAKRPRSICVRSNSWFFESHLR
ncbi:hypothetical protein B0T21DRAFT_397404 [Apiosordaria backusii]|uniref:Uncharacterized protein n=1 Tax=Apiosordaria backusii TaxID=314023 RepID=A0AA40DJP9_9PEZI|nr:hypothetical protein B0T21DRAFT_397404 [Apiosordaria backusii]